MMMMMISSIEPTRAPRHNDSHSRYNDLKEGALNATLHLSSTNTTEDRTAVAIVAIVVIIRALAVRSSHIQAIRAVR